MTTLRLKITGHVQGVFFRAETQAIAKELGLFGWVRNCTDGSVEIHAQGDTEALKQLEEWCHHGPPSAKVDHVSCKNVNEESYETFEITH